MTITLLSRIITSRSVSYRLQPTHRTVTNNVTKFLQPWTKNDVTKLQQPWSNLEKSFHTTPPKLVNPLLLAFIKPMSRIFAMVGGRIFRRWWRALPDDRRAKFKAAFKERRAFWAGMGLTFLAGIVYAYESHVQVCPITKRRRFVALTPDQVEKIATTEFQDLSEQFAGLMVPESHPYYGRMTRVAGRILRANSDMKEIGGKHWTVTVIDRNDKNAFVLPTGNIFVFSGMLDMCTNDDQLGIIISHEIAHTVLGHAGEMLSYVNFLNALLMIPLAVMWAFIPNDGIAAVADWFSHRVAAMAFELPFNRDMETEADEVGLQLAAKACFDVREAPAFWAKMELLESNEPETVEAIEILSTHPSHKNRESHLASLLPEAIQVRSSCGCPKLGQPDPYEEFKKWMSKMVETKKVEKAREEHVPLLVVVTK